MAGAATQPTVTDADLVLGYLDPEYFAGGSMRLDRRAAENAIAEELGEPLGLSSTRAAWGIHDIVNQNMASAARLHVLEQGEDPATSPWSPSAAPARCMPTGSPRARHPRVIYPVNAGVASAFGLMVAPMASNFVRTYKVRLDAIDWTQVRRQLSARWKRAPARRSDGARQRSDIAHHALGRLPLRRPGLRGAVELAAGRAPVSELRAGARATHARGVQTPVRAHRRGRSARDRQPAPARARRPQAARAIDFEAPPRRGPRRGRASGRRISTRPKAYVETRSTTAAPRAGRRRSMGPRSSRRRDTTIIVPPRRDGARRRVPERHRDAAPNQRTARRAQKDT